MLDLKNVLLEIVSLVRPDRMNLTVFITRLLSSFTRWV